MSGIRSVAVLGAGTMGAQIAAHFANAGVPALLLDVTADAARQGLARARKLRPDPFFTPDAAQRITTGGLDTDLARLAEADWVLEAIVERLDAKRAVLEKVDRYRGAGSIVSSNTSGISITALAADRSDDFKRHWLGTHFFNPPRYLRLLELIPTADTDPQVTKRVADFSDRRLGKGVVVVKDSPGFVANHIGLYGVLRVFAAIMTGEYTIEEADAITGPAIGRPKSATFRTMDLAGLDILDLVVRDLRARLGSKAATAFELPPFVSALVEKGWIGEKAGRGFYHRVSKPGGKSEILTLDVPTLDYRPRQPARLAALDAAKTVESIPERVRTLFHADDRVGRFLRATLAPTLIYAARVTPTVAHHVDDVDRVMRWGFGWDLGPFELMDAIGVQDVLDAASQADPALVEAGVPPLVQQALARDKRVFRHGLVPPAAPELQILRSARDRSSVVQRNAGASLIDLGEGVLCLEFHSKMNAIGADALQMIQLGVREATTHFEALVVGNDAPNFSAGANLMLLLLEAQEGNWDEIDQMIRLFQQTNMQIRYAVCPVVVAPAGLALGGGAEVVLHGDRVQAAAETYMGLVEVGVGLIPAAGGTKEMLARAVEAMPAGTTDIQPYVQRAFETIAFGKVSASGPDAQRLGYLAPTDSFTMNRERLLHDARQQALRMLTAGYQPPVPRTAIPVGGDTVLATLHLGIHLAQRAGRISEHDALIGRALAEVMAGGRLPHATTVTEQDLLDLEREAFLKLVGERKTQERIQHMLKTGKALRN